jgi:hypothetical protein
VPVPGLATGARHQQEGRHTRFDPGPRRNSSDQSVGKRNSADMFRSRRPPTVDRAPEHEGETGMSTSTKERTTTERGTWVCDNCHAETATLRKRCTECGTSRY